MKTFDCISNIPKGFVGQCCIDGVVYGFFVGRDPAWAYTVDTGFISNFMDCKETYWYYRGVGSDEQTVTSLPCALAFKLNEVLNHENV